MPRHKRLRIGGMLVASCIRAGYRTSGCFGDDVLSGACLADSRGVLVAIANIEAIWE